MGRRGMAVWGRREAARGSKSARGGRREGRGGAPVDHQAAWPRGPQGGPRPPACPPEVPQPPLVEVTGDFNGDRPLILPPCRCRPGGERSEPLVHTHASPHLQPLVDAPSTCLTLPMSPLPAPTPMLSTSTTYTSHAGHALTHSLNHPPLPWVSAILVSES